MRLVSSVFSLCVRFLLAALLVAVTARVLPADQAATTPAGALFDLSSWVGSNATVSYAAAGASSLRIDFQVADWPNASVTPVAPVDLSGKSVVFRVTNPSNQPLLFYVRIDDDPSADGRVHCRTGHATIGANETANFALENSGTPGSAGIDMRGFPPVAPGARALQTWGPQIDWSHIVHLQIFLAHPTAPASLTLDSVTAAPVRSLDGIVDRFGQYTGADWPGKVHTEADLASQRIAEAQALAASPTVPGLDRFGGWLAGPKLAPATFFRTQMVDGKWWLVTPEGHLFFSVGTDAMTHESPTSTDPPRTSMFTWLPSQTDPLNAHRVRVNGTVQGRRIAAAGFDFYGANLERKYGSDYLNVWRDISLKRLMSWGFNTVGNWSDEFQPNPSVPYVVTLGDWGSHAVVPTAMDYWGAMPDPFDPQFAADLDRSIDARVPAVKNDPLCIGYFVDNELTWGSDDNVKDQLAIGYGALALDATRSPAKRALEADLQKRYPTVADLNTAWGTSFASWSELDATYTPFGDPDLAMQNDLAAFVRHYADQYFGVVSTELRKADPNHLYLGCRFASHTIDEVIEAAKYCDVVSFNIYEPTIDPAKWGFLDTLGKPCIIGEFHFGALDRGMFSPGLVQAADQADRGAMYERYIESVLARPAFVGAHWFEYVDEPLVGRFDGENYNIGFVSQTDTVYPELAAAARDVHGRMYRLRAGGAP